MKSPWGRLGLVLMLGLNLVALVCMLVMGTARRSPVGDPSGAVAVPSAAPSGAGSPGGFSMPLLQRGGRLVAEEFLGPETLALQSARESLLAYLSDGKPADLERAYQQFHALYNSHDWFEAMYEAYCLERMGRKAECDALIRTRGIDRDVYDFCFHGPHASAKDYLASMQLQACVRHIVFMVQALETFEKEHGGTPPASLQELVPQYLHEVLRCPSGEPLGYEIRDEEGGGRRGVIVCDRHTRFGFPVLRGPGTVFQRQVTGVTVDDHVYDQLEWKARRPAEDADAIFNAIATAARLAPGLVVADIGSGIGFYSFPMARRVAPSGEVWAVDVKPSVLEFVRYVNARHPEYRVRTVVSRMNDVCLPAGKFDVVVVAHVYRRLCSPVRDAEEYRTIILPFVRSIHKALKRGGRLVIMDGEVNDTQSVLTVARKTVIREVTPVGFTWCESAGIDKIRGDTPNDYVLVFQKK